MKGLWLAIALISGFAFMTALAFANPATLPKHPGYPDETGKATTATGEAAELKAAEDAPKTLKNQLKAAETSQDRTGNVFTDDPRVRKHPGYPERGVTEDMLKEATKVNANPK